MKKGAIIGKRQIAIAALVVALGGAVWLNMQYANVGSSSGDEDTSSKILGQAQYVNASSVVQDTNDYFAKTREAREEAREEALELLQETVDNAKTSEDARAAAQGEITKIANDIKTEADIESLIIAKGFTDVVAVLGNDDINIVVKSNEKLLASETMQITDIVTAKTKFGADKIKILTSK